MGTESELVLLEEYGNYCVIRLNRPEKRNAMNRSARSSLLSILKETEGRYRVCLLTGTGESFCAGIDLKERLADREAGSEKAFDEWMEVNLSIRKHPAIFIAAVNGYALGGGLTLVNVCDLAIAADEAQLGAPEMGFAAYPSLAGPSTQFSLPRKRAAWMVLTTKRLDGKTAEQWGLVNLSVPREQLMDEAHRLAQHVAQLDPVALREAKRALDRIPLAINDWEAAFRFGEMVNFAIRSHSGAQEAGFQRFRQGERNIGQG